MITVKRKKIKTKTGTSVVLDVRFVGILIFRKYLHINFTDK